MNPISNWMERHRNPVSFWLHMLGIPMTVLAVVLVIIDWRCWLLATSLFVAGYALQFVGHAIEGNRSGEEMLLRRLLSRSKPMEEDKPVRRRQRPR